VKEGRLLTFLSVALLFVVLLLGVQAMMPADLAGAPVRAAADPAALQLLLTEIVVSPTQGEFVEIHNPGDTAVDLSDVYLTDATYAGGGTYYYNIVTGANAGGGGFADFHARFPDGATIDPGEYQTIALAGSDAFSNTYGIAPTYELYEDGDTPDGVPDMREALPGSINNQGGLSNAGEVVILYYWDGQTDLVTDLDYVLWGDKDEAVDKTGVSIDGPDADEISSTYLADTPIEAQDIVGTGSDPHAYGNSAQRVDMTEGAEVKTGGNGADGHDETSEDLSNTWSEDTPTPNTGLSLITLLLTEIVVSPTQGEFVEIHNPGDTAVDLSDVYLTDATYAGGGTYYYNIVTGANAGGGGFADFHARFPDGATIDPGEYQTIALAGSDAFSNTYGIAPTYELYEDGDTPDGVPDMREALPGSINNQGGLSNAGEVVILYYWDGQTDLVTDLDYVLWGDKDEAVDKTGVSIDGPDADEISSTYLADTPIEAQDIVGTGSDPHAYGNSAQRVDMTEGAEVKTGGNGADGHDETSEDLSNTWSEDTPTPGASGAAPPEQPTIISTDPASDAINANPYLPVKAVFDMEMRASTINATNFTLEDESGPISGAVYYDSGRMTAVFDPVTPLVADTVYTATVKAAVASKGGTPMGADYTWSFTTAPVTFNAYHGSIHNHTAYSDGTADPETAFTAGRDRGLDFMAVTDHSYAIDDTQWEDTLNQASAFTVDGTFVALAGCEYTHGSEGHINVFNTIRRPVRTERGYGYADYTPTLASFYDWLVQHPESVGMFNHPAWMNFNDWGYRADAEPMMQLLEVGNGAYGYYVWTEEEYRKALDYGWRVGPSNNGDTHSNEWAIDNPGRTGIWATELTYDGVLEALGAMRTFATEDGDFEIYLKGDGAWMGETIPNDGAIDFEIYVNDPGAENLVSLELYTDQGQVVTSTVPATSPYTWSFPLDISEGVHYYFVRAEQEDGDRTVTAPIWTAGDVDVSPTGLEITPAQLSTQAPANFRARVTNRGIADAPSITVTFRVDDTVVGTQVIAVPAGSDAFATVGWTPDRTGPVRISAQISGVPEGDNPDDNTIIAERNIVDYAVPLIVIDNGHDNNVFSSGSAEDFKKDLVDHGFNWIEDTDGLTSADLANAVLLIISDPGFRGDDLYTEAEEQAIADYVNSGGALLVAGDSDYNDHGNPEEINNILDKIAGADIRMNSDGTYDDTNQGGVGPWHVLWHVLPARDTTGIGVNVNIVVGFSGCSIYGVDEGGQPIPLTTGDGITVTVVGDDDTYQYDGDGLADHFVYPEGVPIPMAAVQELPGGGRIAVWGDSNESFSDAFTYVPGDGYQNEIYNMETIYWLLGRPLEKWTIAEARFDAELNDTPDHLPDLVWVEGQVTARYGNFFDVMYIQDETGGITIYAPVASLPEELGLESALGKWVRVVGRLDIYQGDTEIQIAWDAEQVQIIGEGTVPDPLVLSTHDAALEENEGWLVQTYGHIAAVLDNYNFIVDDGSGPARVFIDGYNGNFAGLNAGDWALVIGLASEDGAGQRIRVRQQSDVVITPAKRIYFPLVFKNATL